MMVCHNKMIYSLCDSAHQSVNCQEAGCSWQQGRWMDSVCEKLQVSYSDCAWWLVCRWRHSVPLRWAGELLCTDRRLQASYSVSSGTVWVPLPASGASSAWPSDTGLWLNYLLCQFYITSVALVLPFLFFVITRFYPDLTFRHCGLQCFDTVGWAAGRASGL